MINAKLVRESLTELSDAVGSVKVIEVKITSKVSLLVRFTFIGDQRIYRVEIPIPAEGVRVKAISVVATSNPQEFTFDLLHMIEEEMSTGASSWGKTRHVVTDVEFQLASYGFQRKNPKEHQRLERAAKRF